MNNILLIVWFFTIFLLTIAVLYFILLKNKDLEKRLNYYLDIERKYKESKGKKTGTFVVKDALKDSNEFIRTKLKKGLTGKEDAKLKQMLIGAGITLKPEEFVMMRLFSTIVTGAFCVLLLKNILFFIPGAFIGFIIPNMWIGHKRKIRVNKFNDALADTITTIISSLRSGYSFSQAIKTVAEESEAPTNEEVKILLTEMNYGISMEEGLNNLYIRMPSVDLELMIQAVLIHRQVGGNLSNILEIIVNTIRERNKLERHVKTLTAQGRFSGKVIGALPIVMGLFLYIINPEYITDFLGDRVGQIAIAVGAFFSLVGFIVIKKITKIEV